MVARCGWAPLAVPSLFSSAASGAAAVVQRAALVWDTARRTRTRPATRPAWPRWRPSSAIAGGSPTPWRRPRRTPGTLARFWQAVAANGTAIGRQGMVDGRPRAGGDCLGPAHRPSIVKAAREELDRRLASCPYRAALKDGQQPLLGYRESPSVHDLAPPAETAVTVYWTSVVGGLAGSNIHAPANVRSPAYVQCTDHRFSEGGGLMHGTGDEVSGMGSEAGATGEALGVAPWAGIGGEAEDVIDDPRGDEEEPGAPIRYRIRAYGADMPVDTLMKRMEDGDIYVPDFQRKFIWKLAQASRFIESLLLGLPVPEIFLFKDPDTRRLLVVDGQQRLKTLRQFFAGRFGQRDFALRGVGEEYAGKTIHSLEPGERRELDQFIIHATIFEQDEPKDDRSSVYSVFERLNTGGTPLQAQEIRSSIYEGTLNELLHKLAENRHWRSLYGPSSPRRRDEELVLRFLALFHALEDYSSPMKRFLNDFMERNRNPLPDVLDGYRSVFERTVETVDLMVGAKALRPDRPVNAAVADAVLVGTATRLTKGPIEHREAFRAAHERLIERLRRDELYQSRTTHENRLRKRILYASEEFGRVQ